MTYLVYILALGGGLFALFGAWKKRDFTLLWVGVYLLAAFAFQAVGHWLAIHKGSNLQLYNASIPAYYAAIFMVFYSFDTDPAYRMVMRIIFGLWALPVLSALVPAVLQSSFAANGIVVVNLAVVTACLTYFYHLLRHPEPTPLLRQTGFLVAMSFFFYFLCSFITWSVHVIFAEGNAKLSYYLGTVNMGLVIVFYIMLCTAIAVHHFGHAKRA